MRADRCHIVGKEGNGGTNCLTAAALKHLCKYLLISRLTQSSSGDKQGPYAGSGLSYAHLQSINRLSVF